MHTYLQVRFLLNYSPRFERKVAWISRQWPRVPVWEASIHATLCSTEFPIISCVEMFRLSFRDLRERRFWGKSVRTEDSPKRMSQNKTWRNLCINPGLGRASRRCFLACCFNKTFSEPIISIISWIKSSRPECKFVLHDARARAPHSLMGIKSVGILGMRACSRAGIWKSGPNTNCRIAWNAAKCREQFWSAIQYARSPT